MFNFIDHLHFYSCEWLCRWGPSALFCLGSIILVRWPCIALMWMKSYLNDRTQRVVVGSVVSNASSMWRVAKFCLRAQIVLYFCTTNQ